LHENLIRYCPCKTFQLRKIFKRFFHQNFIFRPSKSSKFRICPYLSGSKERSVLLSKWFLLSLFIRFAFAFLTLVTCLNLFYTQHIIHVNTEYNTNKAKALNVIYVVEEHRVSFSVSPHCHTSIW